VTPPSISEPRAWAYQDAQVLEKGAEMGRFNMGSTIIVLFGKDKIRWNDNLQAGSPVKLGANIGQCQ
jgi:phosphatidylserine decarboxylase